MNTSPLQLSRRELMLLFERLEMYLSAGLSLDAVFDVLAVGVVPRYRSALIRIRQDINKGFLVSRSISQHIRISRTVAGLIEHGESSGELQKSCAMIRFILEREGELKSKCLSALAYPVIIGLFASLLTLGLVQGVMPQIIPMLKGLRVELPLLTRVVIFITDQSMSLGGYLIIGVIGLIAVHIVWYRVRSYRRFIHSVILYIPFVGGIVHAYALSLFLYSCGSLVESGISLSTAYANTTRTISFIPLATSFSRRISDIERGIQMSSILGGISKRIPSYVPSLVSAGEASGTLGASLLRAATIINRDIEHLLKRGTSLIEPIMMVGIGCMVGGIALSILMPIYDISRVLQHA